MTKPRTKKSKPMPETTALLETTSTPATAPAPEAGELVMSLTLPGDAVLASQPLLPMGVAPRPETPEERAARRGRTERHLRSMAQTYLARDTPKVFAAVYAAALTDPTLRGDKDPHAAAEEHAVRAAKAWRNYVKTDTELTAEVTAVDRFYAETDES